MAAYLAALDEQNSLPIASKKSVNEQLKVSDEN